MQIQRGYNMPVRGCEFYLRMFNSISHSFAALVNSWVIELKFISTSGHVIFCLLYKHQWKKHDLLCNRHNDVDLFTCEDNLLFSHVKIWSFRAKAHLVFHWCLYNKGRYDTIYWRGTICTVSAPVTMKIQLGSHRLLFLFESDVKVQITCNTFQYWKRYETCILIKQRTT